MSASQLHLQLQIEMSWLSPQGRTIVEALASADGRYLPADAVARAVGLPSRHALTRLLQRESLPSFARLLAWVRLLAWLTRFEDEGTSLARQALRAGDEPGMYYRVVRRVACVQWSTVASRGSTWAFAILKDECRRAAGRAAVPTPLAR